MFHVEQKNVEVISKLKGNIVDVINRKIFSGEIIVEDGIITSIEERSTKYNNFILPGFIDSHIHIESSMLTPQHFSRIAVSHGTIATVSDPHEIANVLGLEGIRYMIENAKSANIKFFFGAPSCVPATSFETTGATISNKDIEFLFKVEKLKFLSEMMNFPGVISKNKSILEKLKLAKKYDKRIDGHAPGLRGENLDRYLEEGIETDHECYSYDEALEKIQKGMIIQIRQGSAAKNFLALVKLIDQFPDQILLCSDDLHPNDLLHGHMNELIKCGIKQKVNFFNLIRAATVNPVNHYRLDVGLLRKGDPADFIIVDDLMNLTIKKTYINGELVFQKGKSLIKVSNKANPNKFNARIIHPGDLGVPDRNSKVKVIDAFDGELITKSSVEFLPVVDGFLQNKPEHDILKIVVQNRYKKLAPAVAFIRNFGFKYGAIASSISHDSHNIIAVGVDDKDICKCINWIIKEKGGIVVSDGKNIKGIPLPVAGIISNQPVEWVAKKYNELNLIARKLGCRFNAPFMTLSFMGLLVIPELKLSDRGLFDVREFDFTSLYFN